MSTPIAFALPPLPFGPAIGVPSAMPFVVTGEEYLRLQIVATNLSYPVGIHWRMALPTGQIQVFQERVVSDPAIERAAVQADFPLGAGLILNVGVIGLGVAVQYGHLYARVTLMRGRGAAAVLLGTLLADYITARWGIGWPGSAIRLPSETRNTSIYYTNVAPAAGVEQVIQVPAGANWELLSFNAQLTTDATAGNRTVELRFDDGAAANLLVLVRAPGTQTPSVAGFWSWVQGLPYETIPAGQVAPRTGGLPIGLRLRGGARVRTNTTTLAAGDQWGAARWYVRETLEDF